MKRLLVVWMFVVGWLFFPGTVSAAPLTPDTFAAPAPPIDPRTRIASNLGLLLALSQDEARALPGGDLGEAVARVRSAGAVAVSARFIRTLSAAERAELEALGVAFNTLDGELLHAGCIYGLTLPLDAVDALAAHPLVEWLEAAWHPAVHAPLDVSTPATLAPTVWHFTVPSGGYSVPLTGRGVTVANFDTGIDVTHPAFLDGYNNMGPNDCNWDYNSSGSFDPGTDRFSASSGVLRFWNAAGDPANTGGFDVTQDWVYQDDNGNSAYDVSELIFMARDTDGDGVLESGECLRSRGNLTSGIPTSKIAAVLDATGTTRVRGSDLDLATVDANGHGTSVAGIIAAGNAYWCDPSGMSCTYTYPNTRMYTGVAPGADLLVADRIANSDTTYIPWAATYGADVMLYEYGAWVGQYMDGSSNHEQMMDTYAAQGIVQVVPTGNLHCNASYGCNPRHLQYSLSGSATFNHQFNVPNTPAMTTIYASMIWLNPSNNLTVNLTVPGYSATALPCTTAASGWMSVTVGTHDLWCERAANSSRGTALYNILIDNGGSPVVTGNWAMSVANPGPSAETVNFYIADDSINAWAFGAGWVNAGSGIEKHTATWPSTCDSCIGVASYSTRGTSAETLSWFSGRGTRFLDGARIVDVAAPGHYDVIAPQTQAAAGSIGAYNGTFGGTSAAAPHVAGTAALLLQFANLDAPAATIESAIQRGATSDGNTGTVPNDSWGYGKLNAYSALQWMMNDLGDAPTSANNYGLTMKAYQGVTANFPTVYNATPPGPIHWQAGSLSTGPVPFSPVGGALGNVVSAELEADRWFDEDARWMNWGAAHNIDPLANQPNGEDGINSTDDGLVYPNAMAAPLMHCMATPFNLNVTLTPFGPPTYYLNVWVDWNRDGDWGDTFTCNVAGDASEWAVQNQVVASTGAIATPPVMPYQPGDPYDPVWIRVTLSEQAAPLDPMTSRADGRGPAGGYRYGETEDYYLSYPPIASFQSSAVTGLGCVSDTLVFTNTSTGSPPLTYIWDFGDGTTLVTTTRTTHAHHYTIPGPHRVVLTATDAGGLIYTPPAFQFIHIEPVPVAGFTTNAPVMVSETVTFSNTSVNANLYTWDFGDGVGASMATSPVYSYTLAGVYVVTLTANSGAAGCIDVYAAPVLIASDRVFLPVVLRES